MEVSPSQKQFASSQAWPSAEPKGRPGQNEIYLWNYVTVCMLCVACQHAQALALGIQEHPPTLATENVSGGLEHCRLTSRATTPTHDATEGTH